MNAKDWAAHASRLIGDCFDACLPYLDRDNPRLDPLVRFVLTQLYLSCYFTSESILILTGEGKEWDASILERSLMEGFVKFAYISHGSNQEILDKCEEYWFALPDTQLVGRHNKAKALHRNLKDKAGRSTTDLLLTDEQVSDISKRMSKKDRQALNQKWSFQEIVGYFTSHPDPLLQMYETLLFGYGLDSHLVHKDADGIGMEWERSRRPPIEREAVTQAHSARLISSAYGWPWLNSMFLFKICGQDIDKLYQIKNKYSDLLNDLEKANQYFEDVEYS